jgi:hypothetical protein
MTCSKHNARLSGRVARSARYYLDNLLQHADTQAVIITIESCGCISMQSTMNDDTLAATLMQAAAVRNGEPDH